MAVALNNANTISQVTGTSFSGAKSVTAGASNLCAFCIVLFDGVSAAITGVTYGGQTMTSAGSPANNATGNLNAQIFYLVNPPTGSNTLAVTGNGTVVEIYTNLISFKNVNQTTPVRPGTYSATSGAGLSTASATITSNTNDLTMTCIECNHGISGTNQTSDGTSSAGVNAAGSDHATTAASSVTHTWSASLAINWVIAGLSIDGDSFTPDDDAPPRMFQSSPEPMVTVW